MILPSESSDILNYRQRLLDNRERIIVLFIQRVRQQMPSAKDVDDTILNNSLFEYLTSIAKFISLESASDDWNLIEENIQTSREHGFSRAQIPNYTLDQVISEFRILRSVILFVLEEEGPLPIIERDNIFIAIDNGITQAATEFALRRGFKDARLSEEISAKNLALGEANDLRVERKQREQFFSTVTHDMRNPLSIAKASAELIVRRPSDPDAVRKQALRIIKSIDRSNLMIKDLLDSNRLRSGGRLSLQKEECDLNDLIKECCDNLSQVYGSRFKIHSHASVKGLFDRNGLMRALENLMTNAVKYGSVDRPITISLNKSQAEICLKVHNEGTPIPLKDQASLFEYHKRASAQEGTQQGWGIGLTLVKGIAEAHDGKVEVESSAEDGTTFSIILPL